MSNNSRIVNPYGENQPGTRPLAITLIQIGPDIIVNPIAITGIDLAGFPVNHAESASHESRIIVLVIGGQLILKGKRAERFFSWLMESKLYQPTLTAEQLREL
jgi:hypothetical protein